MPPHRQSSPRSESAIDAATSAGSNLCARSRRDEERGGRAPFDVGRVPHAGRIDDRLPNYPKPRINLLLYHGIHGPSARLRSTAVRTATPPSTSEADPGAFDQGSAEPPEAAPEASSRTPTRAAGRVLLEHRVTEERSRRHLVSLIEQRPAVSICRGQRDRSTLLRCGYGRFRFKPPLAFRLRFAPSILVKSSRGPSVWRGGHRMRAHSAVC